MPGALLTAGLVRRAVASNHAAGERRLIESARVDASALDREFASTISTLRVLGAASALERDDLAAFCEEGRRVQTTQSGWYSIILMSPDGRVLVSTRQDWGAPLIPVADPDSLKRVTATRRPVVGAVRPAPEDAAEPVFAIRSPVMRQERLKYVLTAIVSVDSLNRIVPQQTPDSDEWTRVLLDADGTIAVRTRGAEDYVGAPANDAFRARQVAHMVRLVNDLLDISRLSRGKVHLDRRRFELREAVDRAVDMARPLIAQQRHSLDVSVAAAGLLIDADLDRIVQVLSNLLTNAAKYTPPTGHLAILASASAGQVVVACEDDGPGISTDLMPRLFEPFAQGPRALDRREGGLGLGLALARTFTELHGGTIHVEARAPQPGSRFVVILPLAAAAANEAVNVPTGSVAVASQRVLVVDDNADACEMLRLALEQAGHEPEIAAAGPDALALAAQFDPDVATLDIGLPGMSGYEVARRLRSSRPGIRLIALTGYGRSGDLEAATAAGFDAHCAKPIAIAELLEIINAKTV